MAAVKILIFFGILAVALGLALPVDQFDEPYLNYQNFENESPLEKGDVLVRNARSPQGSVDVKVEHNDRDGTSANIDYVRPLENNWEAYVGAGRNFRENDNNVHAGFRLRF